MVSFNATSYTVNEGVSLAVGVTIMSMGPIQTNVIVNVSTVDESASRQIFFMMGVKILSFCPSSFQLLAVTILQCQKC